MVNIKRQLPFIIIAIFIIVLICTKVAPETKKDTVAITNNSSTNEFSTSESNKELLEEKKEMRKINKEKAITERDEELKLQEQARLKAEEKLVKESTIIKTEQKPQTSAAKTPVQAPASSKPQILSKCDVEYQTQIENDIVTLCNLERAKIGTGSLININALREIAEYKSNEMLQYGYFDHVSPFTGFSPSVLMKAFGWESSYSGENIWYMKTDINIENDSQLITKFKAKITAEKIFTDWMNSPGHKANILNVNFNKIGVGVAFSVTGKAYATQEFSN